MFDTPPLQKWFTRQLQLLWAYEGLVVPAFQHHLSIRHTDNLNAWLILQGGVRLVSGSTMQHVRPGQWLLFGGKILRQDFTPDTRLLSVSFHIQGFEMASQIPTLVSAKEYPGLERAARSLIVCTQKLHPIHPTELSNQQVAAGEFFHLHSRFTHWLEIYFDVCETIGASPESPQTVDPRVTQAVAELTSESLTLPGSVTARLARSVGLTPRHIERLFVQELGASPQLLREKRRMEEAMQQVAHGVTPFKRLAYELGFSSPAHFSNWFRRRFRMSPRQYRSEHSS